MIKTRARYIAIVLIAIVLLAGCKQNKNASGKIEPNGSSLTLLLLNDQFWFSDHGTNKAEFTWILPNELFSTLHDAKKEKGKDLNIIIKTSDDIQKAVIDSVISTIKSQNISTYYVTKMSDKEKETIRKTVANRKPPEPVEVQIPNSVSSEALPEDNALLIDIRKDRTIWYQVISKTVKMTPQKVNEPVTKNLTQVIADFERSLPGVDKKYLVKGDGKTSYKDFEKISAAFKANNILKFNLITSLE